MQRLNERSTQRHLRALQTHLGRENPVLLDVVKSFRILDRVAHGLRLFERRDSLTTKVPWWPMIAVLGTFSAGKSTFINGFLGQKLQKTGNQAVDDRFTVITYGGASVERTLPGRSLDADPRFPFFQISRAIESVAEGEGRRVDAYLQLKTCNSPKLSGKILIDSPGFDADDQRTATLRITDHIIDLADLVLVFFDARHPEPGAMHDTLKHLVSRTLNRPDADKFLFILNQFDNAAREDNPEEVFGAWQRALAQSGLSAGRFFCIYNEEAAIPIADEARKERFARRRDSDLRAIERRINEVEVERAYRVIGVLEHTAHAIRDEVVPHLISGLGRWHRLSLSLDLAGLIVLCVAVSLLGPWLLDSDFVEAVRNGSSTAAAQSPAFQGWLGDWLGGTWLEQPARIVDRYLPVLLPTLGALVALMMCMHLINRRLASRWIARGLGNSIADDELRAWTVRAFGQNTRGWLPRLSTSPLGWGQRARARLSRVLGDADRYTQALNDRFTTPSGERSSGGRRPILHGQAQAALSAPESASSKL